MEEKIQRLSEGFDFIEESTSFSDESLSFQEADELVISESKGEKSPYKILGKACGCFAPIGEFSRNKRLYSDDLWPTVLANEEFSSRLNSRSIFGCISHSDKKVDDIDIREGKVSHIVSKLEIHEDANGKPYLYGELEILDTPAGRILEAMYKGGANLYVSSRGAGKLIPVPGKDYAMVKPDSYFVECFDVVCRPGFLKAKPVYEGVVESKEEEIQEGRKEGESNAEFKARLYNELVNQVEDKAEKKKQEGTFDEEERKKTWKKLDKLDDIYPIGATSEEIQLLKSQIDKLAKIVEKVVDDVYEQPEAEQSVEEQLGDLLNNSSVTDEAYEDVVAVLKNSNPDLVNKIMENSRGRFNDEHAEKSGYKIDYYRFGGNKPYKIVPKDKSYFEASWDSPRYRTLKQAQKHILDTYKKPKEETTNTGEALADFVNLMADTNISEKAFEEIINMISKAKESK